MSHTPAFQFYVNDWLGSTAIAMMTPAQEGAYIRLLCFAWNDPDCSLPDNDDQLAVLSRLGEGWFKGGSTVVRSCFNERDGRLYNERLLLERKKQEEWRKKSKRGGKASAKSRKSMGSESKGGSRVVQPKGNSSSSSSSSVKDKTFDQFWNTWPRKIAKSNAEKAWKKIDATQRDLVIEAALNQIASGDLNTVEVKYCPHAATWLNAKRWTDAVTVEEKTSYCLDHGYHADGSCPKCQ